MSTNTPLDLFKANLELQLRVTRLLRESGQRWLEAASRTGTEDLAEAEAEIEDLLKTDNWQTLATLPTQVFWRQFQQRAEDSQSASRFAADNQQAFAEGLQHAVEDWQKSVTAVFGGGAQPFQDLFKQWGAAWAAPQQGKTGTAKGSARS
ncbi:hypothetical protein E6C76_14260 [Pseudothauera nasutitermitis]|uniref:Phasin domain-containing protein n=1 Tax=Pseudothauera nasutitermitis TaxID=2565930 RepID=A0A4S4AUT7_9RHOO|nr:phasin family protein [Pseudothauera nasutitermitis]THF63747.1 hypothetical protein E6C76_14260 [Pseudothauera nasutitermitis]